jgi:hypothetical protein
MCLYPTLTSTEIRRENHVLALQLHPQYLPIIMRFPYTAQVRPRTDRQAKPYGGACAVLSTGDTEGDLFDLCEILSLNSCPYITAVLITR